MQLNEDERKETAQLASEMARALMRLQPADRTRIRRKLREADRASSSDLSAVFEQVIKPASHSFEMRGAGLGASVSVEDGRAALPVESGGSLSGDWARSELLGAGALAARLHVSTATVANWRAAGHVVAFRRDRRNFLYPTRQFHRGLPTPRMDEICACFPSQEDAWEWLVEPNVAMGGKPPIDWLQAGHAETVVRAAEGMLDYA
ncbi:hypothetical protein AB2M62_18665 [Sphingomonas sp. MMS12-HWE2-04]|uniref:hypothetical protein n=1 Tax=Sphingomonas sp. MMS12-HWE2-04 TaxID=3234199 RepID=UPI00384F4C81